MWRPNDVVRNHKKRAHFIWISLLALIIGYSIWLLIFTFEKRKNPTVSLLLEDDRYDYPTVSICVYADNGVGYGCDSENSTCISSMLTRIYILNGFEAGSDFSNWTTPKANEAYPGSCIDLDLSSLDEVELEKDIIFPPSITFQAEWYVNSTTVTQNSEGALLFFTDVGIAIPLGDHGMSTFVGATPFTRQGVDETEVTLQATDIAMALTENVELDGTTTKIYSASTISSKQYLISEDWGTPTSEIARMVVAVLQPSFSHTIRTEVDPLEWTELLGNIGGTWEFVLILWGIFFIANHREPQYTGRDLVNSAKKGVQNVVRGAASIVSTVKKRRDSGNPSLSESKEEVEVVPAWDSLSGETSERLRSSDQVNPHPPPEYSLSGGQTRVASIAPDGAEGDRHVQVVSVIRKPSVYGFNQPSSKKTPVADDLPRPRFRPAFGSL